MMLDLKSQSRAHQISSIQSKTPIRKPQTITFFRFPPIQTRNFPHLQLKSSRNKPKGLNASSSEESNGVEDADEVPKVNLRWSELLLDPDPDNVVAVGLTGALAWASVHVLWQLFVVMMAILMAAIKYSFVGVLLIFILITLL